METQNTTEQLDAARQFLSCLWPDVPAGLSIPIFTLPGARVFFCGSIDEAASTAEQSKNLNVYFGESLQDAEAIQQNLKPGSRGNTSTAAGIAGLWMDIDVAGVGHSRENLAPTFDAARQLIGEMGLEPSIIVNTGGGLQAHWLFVEPWIFEDAEDRGRAASLASSWIATAQARGDVKNWYVDSTKDLARVMRLPGTINQNRNGHVVTASYSNKRYNPSDFEEHLWVKLPVRVAGEVCGEGDEASDVDLWAAAECLASLKASRADSYDDWIKVGMALKGFNRAEAFSLWDQWSQLSPRYDSDLAVKKWDSFPAANAVGLGSLVFMAREDAGAANRFDDAPIASALQNGSRSKPADETTNGHAAPATPPQPAPAPKPKPNPSRPRIANVQDSKYTDGDGKEKSVVYYVPMPNVMQSVALATGDWPRRASGLLFAANTEMRGIPDHRQINWLNSADELFAWIQHDCDVRWAGGSCIHLVTGELMTPAPKKEFFEYLKDHASPNYVGIECLPHEPPIEDVFYLPCELPPPSTELATPLDELVARFNAETEHDRSLLMAALMTPGWGGPAGSRPAFVFTSDHGKGVGKTATATVLAEIWGGAIGVDGNEDFSDVRRRLLDDESMSKRVCLIDNLKGKLSGSGLEGAITARVIDGKKMYVGQASRPNLLTWYITANTPSLSHDLADRSIVIKLGKQKHEDDFVRWSGDFVRENRAAILSEIYRRLRRAPRVTMPKLSRDRWGAWQDGVLCRMDDGAAIAKIAIDRRPAVNNDLDDAEDIARVVIELVSEHFPDHESKRIFLTRKQLYNRLIYSGVIDKSFNPRASVTWVRDRCGSGPLHFLSDHKTDGERGWQYIGSDWNGGDKVWRIQSDSTPNDQHGGNSGHY